MSFIHTHLHGEFSLLDGCGKSTDYAARAVEIEQEAVALTDHGNLAGALYHAEACYEKDIKPIIGMEAYFEPVAGMSKKLGERHAGNHHLLLISKNKEGFRNLMQLSSIANEGDRFYYNPQVDWDLLQRHSAGLIATSGCVSSYLSHAILGNTTETPEEVIDRFVNIFGDDFFMEVQPHDLPMQHAVNAEIVKLAKQHGLPLLATIDTHYPGKDWMTTQDTAILMRTGTTVKKRDEKDEADRGAGKEVGGFGRAYPTTWMMSEKEVIDHFTRLSRIPANSIRQAIKNTALIAERCEDFAFDKSPKVPKAQTGKKSAEKVLIEWCREGMKRIGKVGDDVYESRLERELEMFRKKDVFDYFVIIGDMVRWAKDQGIRVGPGRGSAGASLVLYLIRVTAMDPIGYDLLFERFMSEARSDMPDVDIDFQHNRRNEVTQYLIEKYGRENVAYVAAFQSFAMKSTVQSVARVHDLDFMEAKKATDTLSDDAIGATLEQVIELPGHEKLAEWRDDHPDQWEICLKLENQIKGMSKHAAAVVVTDQPVHDLMPTMRVAGLNVMKGDSSETKTEEVVTQWSARANAELISTYGFLKIDLLVTEGLTVQQHCIDLIKERHGIVVDLEDPVTHPEVEKPIGEQEVCERFAHGSNLGIFQFGSAGICRALSDIKPTTVDHLIAANAMYRPGPMAYIGAYAKRKNGEEDWEVPEQAESVLGNTFGIITYQEQVMRLFIELAGLDAATADIARKVVGKGVARDIEGKKKLDKLKSQWDDGCRKSRVDKAYSEELFSSMRQMASYSFNRAHAAGYALQAYQDQWLKEHYPLEFYAALLTWDEKKHAETIREARFTGVEVLPPDVNQSEFYFNLVGDSILFGLASIAYIGEVGAETLIRLRPFDSLSDFDYKIEQARVKQKVNSRARSSLTDCGAFDFDGYRDDWPNEKKGERELALIKFAPSLPSELAQHREFLEMDCALDDLDLAEDGDQVNIAGEIVDVKEKKTKKGRPMAFVRLWYDGRDIECVFWEERLAKYKDLIAVGRAVLIRGEWQQERRSVQVYMMAGVRELAEELEKEVAHAS